MITEARRGALSTISAPRLDSTERDRRWDGVVNRVRSATTAASLERGLIDAALIADTATDGAADSWSAEMVEAFEHLGHADRYGTNTEAGLHGLTHLLDPLSDEQLRGLTSSVKGTVMEIRVREMAQAGEIPGTSGLAVDAHLSESLTQAGHDVEIVDATGAVTDLLQVKAGSWASIAPRVEEYASQGIPVAVTSEAAAAAEAAGYGDHVINTGISGTDLTELVADVVDNLSMSNAADELLPELALVTIGVAATMRLKSGQSPEAVFSWMRSELTQVGVANAAGVALQLMTGMTAARTVAALGTRWTMARRRTAAEALVKLTECRSTLVTAAR